MSRGPPARRLVDGRRPPSRRRLVVGALWLSDLLLSAFEVADVQVEHLVDQIHGSFAAARLDSLADPGGLARALVGRQLLATARQSADRVPDQRASDNEAKHQRPADVLL